MIRIKLSVAAFSFALLFFSLMPLIPAAAAPNPAPTQSYAATIQQYKAWIADARDMYPYKETTDKMYRVMMCESGGDRFAVSPNGLWHGLFQYVPSTWRQWWNPYRDSSIYDAKAQIYATAKAWNIGMQYSWSCYTITHP